MKVIIHLMIRNGIFILCNNYLKLFKNIWIEEHNIISYSNLFVRIEFFRECWRKKKHYHARWSLSLSLSLSLSFPPSLLCNYITLRLTTQRIKFNGGSHVRETAIRWLIIPFWSLMNRDFHRIIVAVDPLSSGCLPFSSLLPLATIYLKTRRREDRWSRSAIINPEEKRLIGN